AATSRAQQIFNYNKVNGVAIPFDASRHLEFGRWDTPQPGFNPLSPSNLHHADSVRIRVADRIPLLFGSVMSVFDGVGMDTFGVSGMAIARIEMPLPWFGIVGLEGVTVSGAAARIDSYNSS